MTTRDIVTTFKEMYDADVSHSLISKITDFVLNQVHAWQTRSLDYVSYLFTLIVLSLRSVQIINKAVYLYLGINSEGYAETEGVKFLLSVLMNCTGLTTIHWPLQRLKER